MNTSLKFITAFALAYLVEALSDTNISESIFNELLDILRSVAVEVEGFEKELSPHDTPEVVVKEFIQAYNDLKVAVEEYEALEREE